MIERHFKYDFEDAEDSRLHKDTQEFSNMAKNFFNDIDPETNESRIVRAFREIGPFSRKQVDKLLNTFHAVRGRIRDREPHQAFPEELKKQYIENMTSLISRWTAIWTQL